MYDIEIPSSQIQLEWETIPGQLRKKKPPEETTTWEAIEAEFNWSPNKERVE